MRFFTNSGHWFFGALVAILFALTAQTEIMDIDAAQYAAISRELLSSSDWTKIYCLGSDYLDKPPLLFWLSALSFKLFGISDWAYKLPSLFFAVLGIFSVFKLAEQLQNKTVAYFSAIIFTSSYALYQMAHDIRTDTILCGSVAFAAWQLYEWLKTQSWQNTIGAGLGLGLAMLAKGPVGFFVPFVFFAFAGVVYEWKVSLQGKNNRSNPEQTIRNFYFGAFVKLVVIAIIIALLLLPMCIGLYQQFGLHGLKFFFWYQSFGRITGENTWNNHPDPFFLSHTTLWAFAPWTILLLYALIKETRNIIKRQSQLAFPYFGFVLSLIALSLSKYQLPHYIFVAYPFLAILCGSHATEFFSNKFFRNVQTAAMILAILLAALLNFYVMRSENVFLISICLFTAIAILFIHEKTLAVATSAVLVFISLSLGFQKKLGEYQTYTYVGKYLHEQKISREEFANFNAGFSFSLNYYAQQITQTVYDIPQLEAAMGERKEFYVLADETSFSQLKESKFRDKVQVVYAHQNFPITRLNATFLNPETRENATKRHYLLRIVL